LLRTLKRGRDGVTGDKVMLCMCRKEKIGKEEESGENLGDPCVAGSETKQRLINA